MREAPTAAMEQTIVLDQTTGRLESLCRRAGEAELLTRMTGADEATGLP